MRRAGSCSTGFRGRSRQAEALDDVLDDRAPLVVVDIEVPEETLVERLSARRICASCGMDGDAGRDGVREVRRRARAAPRRRPSRSIRERLRVYARDTQPLVEFYRRRPTFRSVDGDQTPDARGGATSRPRSRRCWERSA